MDMPQVGDVWERKIDGARLRVRRVSVSLTYYDETNYVTGIVPIEYFQDVAKLVERDGKQVQSE